MRTQLILGFVSLATILLTAGSWAKMEPIKHRCGTATTLEVRVVGQQGDLAELWDGNTLLIRDYNIARSDNPPGYPLDCERSSNNGADLVWITMGRDRDLPRFYRVIRDANKKAIAVSILRFAIRDSQAILDSDSSNRAQVTIATGRKQDVFYRVCADWKGDPKQWGYGGSRTVRNPPCTGPISNDTNGRFIARHSEVLPFDFN